MYLRVTSYLPQTYMETFIVGPLTKEQYDDVWDFFNEDDDHEAEDADIMSYDNWKAIYDAEAECDTGVSKGDLARDAKDPHDIYS
jgi:hypothetical protein